MPTTSKYHIRLQNIDVDGNQIILYLESTASDILIDTSHNTNLPPGVKTLQDLVNQFDNGTFDFQTDDLLHFVLEDEYTEPLPTNFYENLSEISDDTIRNDKTWSSTKINSILEDKEHLVEMIENCTSSQKARIKAALGI